MAAPAVIADLVRRFDEQLDEYRTGRSKEAQLRRDFLDPLFAALGWDVENKKGYAEAYRQVIHEAAIKVGGRTKAPDYCFRAGGGKPSFFVEAKKPAVDIGEAVSPAYQLRRYAWSAKLPVSILTDFEEFAVYDCRIRPARNDKAATARILYLTYKEYLDRWDELCALLAPESIHRGALERFLASRKVKKGTAEVDAAFLAEIETWRDLLARNLALRNPEISPRDLNVAVQRTIDRTVFLRICEDRGIEPYGTLQGLLNGTAVYRRLGELFQRADERYNSGLFHFTPEAQRAEPPDELTLALAIDDKPLKDIIGSLYYPESPYEFSVLPAEILGQVYEQFLGKVIRLTKGHQAKVEEKPEVRKAGGVYYTPAYIVDYIVEETVGRLLEGKTPAQAARLRVLDPACGSGSFLIGAYQQLLDWHRDQYVGDDPEKHARGRSPCLYRGPAGDWRLTTPERKRILLNSVYGVDIDPQAVEVTKLSLLLKVLEGVSKETVNNQLRLFHERALPDLGRNIKCGNSLVGPDFYRNHQRDLFDEEEMYRINAFDWHDPKHGFGQIMKAGGFDAVIGNPPYVRQESLKQLKEYLQKQYDAFDSTADLYVYFMERAVRLLRAEGRFSFIVSSSLLRATYARSVRQWLRQHAALLRIVDFGGLAVFANAKDTYVCIPSLAKRPQPETVEVCKVRRIPEETLGAYVAENRFRVPQERLNAEAWSLKSDAEAVAFAGITKAGEPLGRYIQGRMFRGILTGFNEAFVLTQAQRNSILRHRRRSTQLIKPFLAGQDIRRYEIRDEGRYLIVIPSGWTRDQVCRAMKKSRAVSQKDAWAWLNSEHPGIAKHLAPFAEPCRRREDQGEFWWELRPCDYYHHFDSPKIVFPDICKGPRFYLDRAGMYLANTAYCLGNAEPYLLGLLNSRLFWFAISNISIPFGVRAGQYRYRLIYQYMEKVPVRRIDFSDRGDRARHDRVVELVEGMLGLPKRAGEARTEHEKEVLQRQIEATDRQIDELVYELYGLTDEQIRIVVAATDLA